MKIIKIVLATTLLLGAITEIAAYPPQPMSKRSKRYTEQASNIAKIGQLQRIAREKEAALAQKQAIAKKASEALQKETMQRAAQNQLRVEQANESHQMKSSSNLLPAFGICCAMYLLKHYFGNNRPEDTGIVGGLVNFFAGAAPALFIQNLLQALQ